MQLVAVNPYANYNTYNHMPAAGGMTMGQGMNSGALVQYQDPGAALIPAMEAVSLPPPSSIATIHPLTSHSHSFHSSVSLSSFCLPSFFPPPSLMKNPGENNTSSYRLPRPTRYKTNTYQRK